MKTLLTFVHFCALSHCSSLWDLFVPGNLYDYSSHVIVVVVMILFMMTVTVQMLHVDALQSEFF